MEKLIIRDEIKLIVDNHFDFMFDTLEVPMKRSEFISILTKEVTTLFKKYRNYKADMDNDDEPIID